MLINNITYDAMSYFIDHLLIVIFMHLANSRTVGATFPDCVEDMNMSSKLSPAGQCIARPSRNKN